MSDTHPLDKSPFEDVPYVTIGKKAKDRLKLMAQNRDSNHGGPAQSTHAHIRDTSKVHYVGLCGELAVAVWYDLHIEVNNNLTDGDPGFDFDIYYLPQQETGTIDVKTITYPDGHLLVPTRTEGNADAYFLCEKRGAHVALIGTATKRMVLNADIDEETYPEPCYEIPRDELHPIPERTHVISIRDVNL